MRSKTNLGYNIALAVLSVLICQGGGCSDRPTLIDLRGKILWQGQPVGTGEIMFVPYGSGQPAVAVLQPDGTFEVRSQGGHKGIAPGQYRVSIRSYKGSFIDDNVKYLVPERFSSVDTSNLAVSVPANGEAITVEGSTEDLMIRLD